MAFLRLSDYGTKAVLREYQLTTSRRIGRGQFCAVYAAEDHAVLKLTADSIQLESVRDYLIGPHFPKVLETFGYVGEQHAGDVDLLMYKSERLNPMRTADIGTRRLARKVIRSVDQCWNSATAINKSNHSGSHPSRLASRSEATLEQLVEDTSLPESIREAFEDILRMAQNYQNIVLDFHGANLMVRGTDELVFNDVVVSAERLAAL